MATTLATILTHLRRVLYDSTDVKWADDLKKQVVNEVINQDSFPHWYIPAVDVIGETASSTWTFAISAAITAKVPPEGIYQVEIEGGTGEPPSVISDWELVNDEGSLQVRFGFVPSPTGRDISIRYRMPHPELATESASTDLPGDWVVYQAASRLCALKFLDGHEQTWQRYQAMAQFFQVQANNLKMQHRKLPPSTVVRVRRN